MKKIAIYSRTFELWYWRRLLRVPWAARRSNQSILKEISPGCSLEGMMLKLKLQFFFFNFILFFFLFLNFTILYWFCQISKWIHHRYTCVPHSEPSSLLPPHTIPLGRPSAPAPSIQYRASNLDWWFVSYMILYMFKCHSPKSSLPFLSHRIQKTVLYIGVSFAVLYTGLFLPSF